MTDDTYYVPVPTEDLPYDSIDTITVETKHRTIEYSGFDGVESYSRIHPDVLAFAERTVTTHE